MVSPRPRPRPIGGRPTVVTPEIIRAARDMLPNPGRQSDIHIASLLGVSPGTLYNHIPDLRELPGKRTAATSDTAAPSAAPHPDQGNIMTNGLDKAGTSPRR